MYCVNAQEIKRYVSNFHRLIANSNVKVGSCKCGWWSWWVLMRLMSVTVAHGGACAYLKLHTSSIFYKYLWNLLAEKCLLKSDALNLPRGNNKKNLLIERQKQCATNSKTWCWRAIRSCKSCTNFNLKKLVLLGKHTIVAHMNWRTGFS